MTENKPIARRRIDIIELRKAALEAAAVVYASKVWNERILPSELTVDIARRFEVFLDTGE